MVIDGGNGGGGDGGGRRGDAAMLFSCHGHSPAMDIRGAGAQASAPVAMMARAMRKERPIIFEM